MSYITEKFLLKNKTAEKLYNDYAKDMPIFDYHCHLPEKQILENKPFADVYEIWLSGDHYKWRLMRNFGVDEEYITGSASNKDKFLAYCRTLGTEYSHGSRGQFAAPTHYTQPLHLRRYRNALLPYSLYQSVLQPPNWARPATV